jgi:hypothetical protein
MGEARSHDFFLTTYNMVSIRTRGIYGTVFTNEGVCASNPDDKLVEVLSKVVGLLVDFARELLIFISRTAFEWHNKYCWVLAWLHRSEHSIKVLFGVRSATVFKVVDHRNGHLQRIHCSVRVEVETVKRWKVGCSGP